MLKLPAGAGSTAFIWVKAVCRALGTESGFCQDYVVGHAWVRLKLNFSPRRRRSQKPPLRYAVLTDPAERPIMEEHPGTALGQQGTELQVRLFSTPKP